MEEDRRTYLTPQEAEQIADWVDANDCDLSRSDIILCFDFWIFGTDVVLEYRSPTHVNSIVIRKDGDVFACKHEAVFEEEKTVNTLNILNFCVPLALSPAVLNAFITNAQRDTEAHFAEECEPPGFSLSFHVGQAGYHICAGSQEIESIKFN